MKRADRRLTRVALAVPIIALAVAWTLFLRPQALGGPSSYVIVSGKSMEPTLQNGDLVVALKKSSYRIGEVVAYQVPAGEPGASALVIHRITGGSARDGYVTQGDNRDGEDLWRPTPADVVGAMNLRLPRVGLLLMFTRTPLGIAICAGVVAFCFISTGAARRKRVAPYPTDAYSLAVRFPTLMADSPRRWRPRVPGSRR